MRTTALMRAAWLAQFLWSTCVFAGGGLRERGTAPSAISVPPTEAFDGNDGPWSSFYIQVGTPAQILRVLVSTAISATWVIISAGCPASVTTCPNGRGGIYTANTSSTWEDQGDYELYVEENLDIVGAGMFGNDTVSLAAPGSGGPTLQKQTVGGIAAQQFWLGMLGVNPKPTNFTNFTTQQPSYMTNLKEQDIIPSISFGYTAGNQYRLKTVLGSLTLGGYDSARFAPNDLSFTFAPDDSRDLVVGIQAITYADESQKTRDLLGSSSGILAYVDSTIAEIWLPESACAAFEAAFGLVYDPVNKLYPINSTWQSTLQSRNPNVTFTIGNTASGGATVDIILPYAAFDLEASWPKYPNNTLYFPLQRAANETQITLGRTLLQEAYLIVDWERGNFSLSQCIWPENLGSNLVIILPPPNSTLSPSQPGTAPTTSESGSNTIGIAVGVAIGVLFVVSMVALFFVMRRRKSRKSRGFTARKVELDNDTERPRYEVPGSQPLKSDAESIQLLTRPPSFTDKGTHPAFAANPATVIVSELKGDDQQSPSGSAYIQHEMYGSSFAPVELPAADRQELLGSSPELAHLSSPSSLSSTPLMDGDGVDVSPVARASGASPAGRSHAPSPLDRVASLRRVFGRPGYRRQESTDFLPGSPSEGNPGDGAFFSPISPVEKPPEWSEGCRM
ncbi:hypothetical protein MMC34_002361 [Xylographa carneopallida]|nr:hypothetical protein [Xylographa carneopallida]